MKITRVLMVVMITEEDNVNEGVVGILLSLSLQQSGSLQQKEGGQLLRIMISRHITKMISWTIPEEPMHVILLLKTPMQDSQTVT
jgi:hypothetical protein